MLDAPQIVITPAQHTAVIRLTISRAEMQYVWACYLRGPESGGDPGDWQTELNRPLILQP